MTVETDLGLPKERIVAGKAALAISAPSGASRRAAAALLSKASMSTQLQEIRAANQESEAVMEPATGQRIVLLDQWDLPPAIAEIADGQ